MCWKQIASWWHGLFNDPPLPDPPPPIGGKKIALLFAINNYPGTANDLNGCLNDQRNIANKLNELFPGEFTIKKFSDSEVTVACYLDEIHKAIAELSPGATVIVMADSCFSGTITKLFNTTNLYVIRNRFYSMPSLPPRKTLRRRFAKGDVVPLRWLTFAGCKENQTSADAFIGGAFNGAFTYYAVKCLEKGVTYKEWEREVQKYLPNLNEGYDQVPYLEGPDELANRQVFEGEVLLIHNSSHGTQVYDTSGDEADGYDEALYLYDGPVRDDQISMALSYIP